MSDSSDPQGRLNRQREIAALYQQYGHVVLGRCRYLLGEEEAAKDASQEVFVKVMRSIEGFRGESQTSTWIIRIATNHCLNLIAQRRAKWRERHRQHVKHMDDEGLLLGADPESARMVKKLLAKLDQETQQIAIHYYVDEMTQEEIGQAMGRSLPTVRKRLKKFQRVAQKELGHEAP